MKFEIRRVRNGAVRRVEPEDKFEPPSAKQLE